MRTPAGKECQYYYEDYYRGRSLQECRLLPPPPESLPWEPHICTICPIPDIQRANGCPHMTLRVRLVRRLLRRRVKVDAYCTRHSVAVKNPYIGCGQCHPDAAAILAAEEVKR